MGGQEELGHVGQQSSSGLRSFILGGGLWCFYHYGPSDSILSWVLLVVLFMLGNLYLNQSKMLYAATPIGMPRFVKDNPPSYRSPEEHDMNFESVMVETADGEKVHAWLILQKNGASKDAPTILYFHGNAGNIGTRLPYFKMMYDNVGVNFLAVDYRGYGNSTGAPSEEGLTEDARSCLRYLKGREDVIDPKKIIAFGRSLGGAVAIGLLASDEGAAASALVLENVFTSVEDLAIKLFGVLKLVKPLLPRLLKNHWDSVPRIATISRPILFLGAKNDELVPPAHMKRLYVTAAKSNSDQHEFVVFEHSGHNDIPMKEPEKYVAAWKSFLSRHCNYSQKSS